MRSYLVAILISLVGFTKVVGQGNQIDKLIFLYIDEKYEKCVNKGLSLIDDDDYRKEPLPYLYVSMSYYEIARTDELIEDYPKAFKNAMKYAYKYRKKDKNLEYVGKYADYFETLKDSANELAQFYYKTENYKKAAYNYKQISRFDPDASIMQLWQGICEIKSRNIGEGERNLTMAMEKIDEEFKPDEIDRSIAYTGFTEYADYMDSKGDYSGVRKGKKLAAEYKEYDPEVIKEKEAAEVESNKPVKQVKTFVTSEEEAESQEKEFIGSKNRGAQDAKDEINKITEEQKGEKREVKTFKSDDE